MVEEVAGEAVRARSLTFQSLLKSLVHFLNSYWSEKGSVLFLSDKGWYMLHDLVDGL